MTDTQKIAIVFTGRQGAGKTVLSRALKNALQTAGITVKSSGGRADEDTLIVETTPDERMYLSTGAQVHVGTNVLVPRSVLVGWAREFEEREGGNEGEDCVTPFDAYLYGRDKAAPSMSELYQRHKTPRSLVEAGRVDEAADLVLDGVKIPHLSPGRTGAQETLDAVHAVAAQYEDQPADLRGPVQIETALQAIAALTEKFLPEQDVRTQEALGQAVQDFAKATGKTVVVLLGEDAEKWTNARHPRARVDPQNNPNRGTYVTDSVRGAVRPIQPDGHVVSPENAHAYRRGMAAGLHALCGITHAAALNAGWYMDPVTGTRIDRNVPEMLCLIHSEISEAMEGYRKGLMDDHLTDRLQVEVELADAVIRIGDLCGYLGLDLAGAVIEKMAYNAKREDHKLENRAKGGKAF